MIASRAKYLGGRRGRGAGSSARREGTPGRRFDLRRLEPGFRIQVRTGSAGFQGEAALVRHSAAYSVSLNVFVVMIAPRPVGM
jgi:hypothetical protein